MTYLAWQNKLPTSNIISLHWKAYMCQRHSYKIQRTANLNSYLYFEICLIA